MNTDEVVVKLNIDMSAAEAEIARVSELLEELTARAHALAEKLRYPLWCVDSPDTQDMPNELRYSGSFVSREAAEEARSSDDDLIRRCRPIAASEIVFDFDTQIIEELDHQASNGEVPETARVEQKGWVVSVRAGVEDEARAAFNAWADKYIAVKAYVCEGDE